MTDYNLKAAWREKERDAEHLMRDFDQRWKLFLARRTYPTHQLRIEAMIVIIEMRRIGIVELTTGHAQHRLSMPRARAGTTGTDTGTTANHHAATTATTAAAATATTSTAAATAAAAATATVATTATSGAGNGGGAWRHTD